MSLIDLTSLLQQAQEERYAVGAFNVMNLETVQAVIGAAEATRSPVIIEVAEVHAEKAGLESLGPIMLHEAECASVPVCVHLDHGTRFELLLESITMGFSSVMADFSDDAYPAHIARTQEIVKIAHTLNCDVEAELGHIASSEDTTEQSGAQGKAYTDPEQAKDFVAQTGIDALAISFGSVHGIYKKKPQLDYARIRDIASHVDVPLVMHGGSGLEEAIYHQVIQHGISKINYYSACSRLTANEIKTRLNRSEEVFFHDIAFWGRDIIKAHICGVMDVFGSSGKA
ncbi:ketose-bisphosphate aldolase [candidate division KSB3 bacterium]|nr:MAG: ketose-bisphosphate aldolase [candidate division KSB3 bacterium]